MREVQCLSCSWALFKGTDSVIRPMVQAGLKVLLFLSLQSSKRRLLKAIRKWRTGILPACLRKVLVSEWLWGPYTKFLLNSHFHCSRKNHRGVGESSLGSSPVLCLHVPGPLSSPRGYSKPSVLFLNQIRPCLLCLSRWHGLFHTESITCVKLGEKNLLHHHQNPPLRRHSFEGLFREERTGFWGHTGLFFWGS